MKGKKARFLRKGYKEAGALYWTSDMEKAIRMIHRAKNNWRFAAIVEAVLFIGAVVLWTR